MKSRLYTRCFPDKRFTETSIKISEREFVLFMVDKDYTSSRGFLPHLYPGPDIHEITPMDVCLTCKWGLKLLLKGCNGKSFELNT